MSNKILVTRNQLAKFLPTPELIKAFENLFKQSTVDTPTDVEALSIDIASANASAIQAESTAEESKQFALFSVLSPSQEAIIAEILKRLDEMATDPVPEPQVIDEVVEPRVEPQENIDHLLLPPQEKHGFADLDYIQFRNTYQRVKLPGQLHWSYTYGDLQFTHIGGLVQNVGIDTIAHVYNNTGATISKGTVLSYNGVSGDEIVVKKYIADGTIPSQYIVGIASEDISNNSSGHAHSLGYIRDFNVSGSTYGETWANGDLLYASPTTAGGLTKTKPTAPNVCLPIATVLDNSSTVGDMFVRVTPEQQLYYGSFSDTTDQTAAAINTAYGLTFDTSSSSNGVSIGTPTSRIVIANSGLYEFSFSCQVTSNSASTKTLWFWPRKNGSDIANSAMKSSISGSNVTLAVSRSMFFSMAAGDYLEAMWATDDTGVTIEAAPSTAFAPATPSVVMSVAQIAQ